MQRGFIIYSRIEKVNRPTGINETNLLLVEQQWVSASNGDSAAGIQQFDSLLRNDLDTLTRLPDVESVAPINSIPLLNSSWTGGIALKPGPGTKRQEQRPYRLLLRR